MDAGRTRAINAGYAYGRLVDSLDDTQTSRGVLASTLVEVLNGAESNERRARLLDDFLYGLRQFPV